jgi:hypothetical protein
MSGIGRLYPPITTNERTSREFRAVPEGDIPGRRSSAYKVTDRDLKIETIIHADRHGAVVVPVENIDALAAALDAGFVRDADRGCTTLASA